MSTRNWLLAVLPPLLLFPGLLLAQSSDDSSKPSWQEIETPPPAPVLASDDMEVPLTVPHMYNYGFVPPPGWNLAGALNAVGEYDSNPIAAPSAKGSPVQRYSGLGVLTYRARHDAYQLAYNGSWVNYTDFHGLSATRHYLDQSYWHQISNRTDFRIYQNLRRYPMWGVSAFGQSSLGALLLALSGLSSIDLRSNVDGATTGVEFTHRVGKRDSIHVNMLGNVDKYKPDSNSALGQLLEAPPSSTWAGTGDIFYDHRLNGHRQIGAGVGLTYFAFTEMGNSMLAERFVLRYSDLLFGRWAYSVSAGPQFLNNRQSHGANYTSVMVTGDISRKTSKSVITFKAERGYTTGYAQSSISNWQISGSAERIIGRRSYIGAYVNAWENQTYANTGQILPGSTHVTSVSGSAGTHLTQNLIWFVNYGFVDEEGVLTLRKQITKQQFATGVTLSMDRLFSR